MMKKISRIVSIITFIAYTALIILLGIVNIIPFKIYSIVLFAVLLLNVTNTLIAFKLNINKIIGLLQIILSLIFTSIALIVSFYLFKTICFMNNIGNDGYKVKNYSVIVLKEQNFRSLIDLNNQNIALLKTDTNESKVIEYIEDQIKFNLIEFDDLMTVTESLYNLDSHAIIIENSYKDIIEELDTDFESKTKVVYTFSLKYKSEDISKNVDVTKDPFAIYISGIDTYGEINSVSRSDVNILAIVNPKTYQVLLVSIPRDYYVQLHGTTGYKDKLTHAGMYGVEMSVQTIEDLLDIDINYYVKVNFTSLIDIVDALGNIDVYSEYAFTSQHNYYFYKGYNSLNGKQALDFARTRKAFIDGDRQRGKNQQAVIEAVIRKVASKAIITKYDALLNAINGKFQTNLATNDITSLAKLQLDKMPTWTVKSISLNGSDSTNYTYTYSSGKIYVMEPYLESINDAKNTINKIYTNEILSSSYGEVSDVKKPEIVKPIPENKEPFSLNITEATLKVGESVTLVGKNAGESLISWVSSNPNVATVSKSGTVLALEQGVTTITASISEISVSCIIRVTNPLEDILPEEDNDGSNSNKLDDEQELNINGSDETNNEDLIEDDKNENE